MKLPSEERSVSYWSDVPIQVGTSIVNHVKASASISMALTFSIPRISEFGIMSPL